MGSLRNPVGPLPSSIYWRRRAVALSVVVVLALLAVWVFVSGDGGGGDQAGGGKDDGRGATSPITPGPSATESLPDDRPGGREDPGGTTGGDSGGGEGDGDGADAGPGSGSGSGAGGGTGGAGAADGPGSGGAGGPGSGSGGSGSGGGAAAGGGSGGADPGAANLPVCAAGPVKLGLVSVENTYAPGERPKLRLTMENSGGADCRVGVGPGQAVITISNAEDDTVWASDHCAEDADAAVLRVPAGAEATHTVGWDRRRSAERCPKDARRAAGPGTYLAEVEIPGLGTAQTSFVLTKD
ncbi:hypothetical protein V1J52_19820 [Streptomyces sp. TRM 70351]|uniref:hypothetical protein n=1 Tax=Streptomyces sp. TRM 70351 TaxID=3116552 RepID=UPI002E7B131C|nr:hypothetical protein [Streptomyces sp. TRM 70351]MEE1930403.1 hypothetical protein [Streptomyces sp. TRM 70351]